MVFPNKDGASCILRSRGDRRRKKAEGVGGVSITQLKSYKTEKFLHIKENMASSQSPYKEAAEILFIWCKN